MVASTGAASTGVALAEIELPEAAVVASAGLSTGTSYSIDANRIVADGTAEWGFVKPTIKVDVVTKPAYLRRPMSANPIPPSIEGDRLLEVAAKYVGTPYVHGGASPSGFDCTGFISYVYSKFGVSLPRSSSSYYYIGTRVSPDDARPGDLIVSNGHVAIYAGGNLQIDAPRPGKTIQFRRIWQHDYIFVRVS